MQRNNVLLFCGILSSLVYVGLNIFIPMQWPSYDSASQTVSELSAIGAPTRMLWVILSFAYTILVVAFGLGILKSGDNRSLRICGILFLIYGALGFLWPFAPMHLRDTLAAGGGTISDTMHIALAVATQLLFLASMGFAALGLPKWFRIYSAMTFLILCIFGALTFIDAPNLSKNLPTPLIGVWERINIGVFLLWVVVLSVTLIRKSRPAPRVNP